MDEHLLDDADAFLNGETSYTPNNKQSAAYYAQRCAVAYEMALRTYLHERIDEGDYVDAEDAA